MELHVPWYSHPHRIIPSSHGDETVAYDVIATFSRLHTRGCHIDQARGVYCDISDLIDEKGRIATGSDFARSVRRPLPMDLLVAQDPYEMSNEENDRKKIEREHLEGT